MTNAFKHNDARNVLHSPPILSYLTRKNIAFKGRRMDFGNIHCVNRIRSTEFSVLRGPSFRFDGAFLEDQKIQKRRSEEVEI